MSSKPTTEPPAVKKRGRQKKVVAEDAGTTQEVVKKVVAKSGKAAPTTTATATAATGMKNAPQFTTTAPEQPTPITPSTSKILEEVKAKGTLKKAQQSGNIVEQEAEAIIKDRRKAHLSQSPKEAPQKTPPPPHSKPATSSNHPSTPNKPSTTSPRTTTIPLPSKPTIAPSPLHPSPRKPTTSRLHNPYPSIRPSPSQPQPRPPPSPYQKQHPTRIIEPTPDIRLPPKYQPAARRVTAIIVGLPIVFVVGYELFERWRGKDVRRKFVEDREVFKQIDRERERERDEGK